MAALPVYDAEPYAERRASRRMQVTCTATLETMTTRTPGTIANISEAGARFESDDLPAAGATALLRWNGHEVVCTIVWSRDDACGLAFKHPLSTDVVVETAALNRVVDLPIASVGNITQGQRRELPFRRAEVIEDAEEPVGTSRLAGVFSLFRR